MLLILSGKSNYFNNSKIPATRISQIIKGNRRLTSDTDLRFAKYFGYSAEFWLGIQMEYDLRKENATIECVLEEIQEY